VSSPKIDMFGAFSDPHLRADGTASTRVRRHVPETGSFGKSTRRSRSRTGTPAAKREDPTLAASDRIFAEFLSRQPAASTSENQRKTSGLSASASQSNVSTVTPLGASDGNAGPAQRYVHKEPTEVCVHCRISPDSECRSEC
jgi:hypothetical protein